MPTCAPRRRKACSPTLQTCCRRRARSLRLGLRRSASHFATRSPRRTGSSAPASLSRWRWNFSCRRMNRSSGTSTGATNASTGTSIWVSLQTCCCCGPTVTTSCRTIRPAPLMSSLSSPGASTNSKVSPSEPTSISRRTPQYRGSGSTTSTRRRTSATCPT